MSKQPTNTAAVRLIRAATPLLCGLAILTGIESHAYAASDPSARCGLAVAAAKARLFRADTRALNRCALAILQPRRGRQPQRGCRALRDPGIGVDRADASARKRIIDSCSKGLPAWWPQTCADQEAADCSVRAVHCLATKAAESTYGDIRQLLGANHPGNLSFEFGGLPGNSFIDCFAESGATTTTSSTTSSTLPTTTSSTLPEPGSSRLVITEIMNNPDASSDSAGEYFEIYNAGDLTLNLSGAVVSDLGSNSFTIDEPLLLAPGEYAALGRSAEAGGGQVRYAYGTAMTLSNSADQIIIVLDGVELDRVEYDGTFLMEAGRSMELDAASLDEQANDLGQSWCLSVSGLPDGDMGTPGSANTSCQ